MPARQCQRITGDHAAVVSPVQPGDVLAQRGKCLLVAFDEACKGAATAQRFQPRCPGAGKGVNDDSPVHNRTKAAAGKDVEQ